MPRDDDRPRRARPARDDDDSGEFKPAPRRKPGTPVPLILAVVGAIAFVVLVGGAAAMFAFVGRKPAPPVAAMPAGDADTTLQTPLKFRQAERPDGTFTIRGKFTTSAFFNYDYLGKEDEFFSFEFRDDPYSATVYFYSPRESADGKRLMQIAQSGKLTPISVELRFGTRSTSVARLVRVVALD